MKVEHEGLCKDLVIQSGELLLSGELMGLTSRDSFFPIHLPQGTLYRTFQEGEFLFCALWPFEAGLLAVVQVSVSGTG